jgi:hypothetical protein
MENPQYDKDFYDFFSNLINDDEEVDLLRKILEGKDEESIVKEYIQNLGENDDDQN